MGETLRDIQKRYASRALCLALVAGLMLIVLGYKPVGKGLILGTLFSALNFVLIGELLARRMAGFGWRLAGVVLRMALMAVPLVIAVKQPQFGLWGVVPGLFSVPAMILIDQVTIGRRAVSGRIQEG